MVLSVDPTFKMTWFRVSSTLLYAHSKYTVSNFTLVNQHLLLLERHKSFESCGRKSTVNPTSAFGPVFILTVVCHGKL